MHIACDRLNHLTELLKAYGKMVSIKCMLHFHDTLESKDSNKDTGNKQSLFNQKIEGTNYSTKKVKDIYETLPFGEKIVNCIFQNSKYFGRFLFF